jgi:hypothetical protein
MVTESCQPSMEKAFPTFPSEVAEMVAPEMTPSNPLKISTTEDPATVSASHHATILGCLKQMRDEQAEAKDPAEALRWIAWGLSYFTRLKVATPPCAWAGAAVRVPVAGTLHWVSVKAERLMVSVAETHRDAYWSLTSI